MNEDEYKKELEENGVELDIEKKSEDSESTDEELDTSKDETNEEDSKVDDTEEDSKEETNEEEESEDLDKKDEVVAPKKRSIYQDYKENKRSLKEERNLREIAEKERDELKEKLSALNSADTSEEKYDALTDLEEYAKEIDADPEALKKLQSIILKNVKPNSDIQEKLDKFEAWQRDNAEAISKSEFEKEFKSKLSDLKEIFPNASDSEMSQIKDELDKLAHTEDWSTKELDYIAFKNKKSLGALISPKKKGFESKANSNDVNDNLDNFEFNPNADLTKLSPAARAAWKKSYDKLTETEGLTRDADGGMLII